MELFESDPERVDGTKAQRGEQARPVREEQLIERPADPVVVQELGLPSLQAEQRGVVVGRPGAQPVERLAPEGQVAHEHTDRLCWGEVTARIWLGEVVLEQLGKTEALEDCVHGREPGDQLPLDGDLPRIHEHSLVVRHRVPPSVIPAILHRSR